MRILFQFALLLVCISPSVSFGITALNAGQAKEQLSSELVPPIVKEEKIYLLSWEGDYLRTTAGTVYLKGLKVIEHAKIDRNTLNQKNSHLEVEFTHVDNQIKQIDIYPQR